MRDAQLFFAILLLLLLLILREVLKNYFFKILFIKIYYLFVCQSKRISPASTAFSSSFSAGVAAVFSMSS
jgi:hypothetical protein